MNESAGPENSAIPGIHYVIFTEQSLEPNRYLLVIYVPTYNRLDKLRICLTGLARQVTRDVLVYIANNASTDGTKEYLDSLNYDWLHVEHRPRNLGSGANILLGWSVPVDSEFIWLIGDDDYPTPWAIETLTRAIREHPCDFIFCNTAAFPATNQSEVVSQYLQGSIPSGFAVKGKLEESVRCNFGELVNPLVADSLLLEMMCLCARKSALRNCLHFLDELEQANKTQSGFGVVGGKDAHFDKVGRLLSSQVIPLMESFSHDTPSLYLAPPLTINFWGGHEWLGDYDFVFPVSILYLLKGYRSKEIISKQQYDSLLNYYFQAMGGSIQRQSDATTSAPNFSEDIWSHILEAHHEMTSSQVLSAAPLESP